VVSGAGSWRALGVERDLPRPPRSDQPHHLLTARAKRRGTSNEGLAFGWFGVRIGRRVPRLLFGGRQDGRLAKQGPHAVGADFGGWMQPAESADPGETARQYVLQKPSHEFPPVQVDRGRSFGLAVAIVPPHCAVWQELDLLIGGGGLEDVTGEITQGVFT